MTETGDRLRTALAGSGYDWLVMAKPENVFYATGYRSIGAELMATHHMVALVSPERTVVVGPASDAAAAFEAGIDPEDYIPFGTFYFESSSGGDPEAAVAGRHESADEALMAAVRMAAVGGRVGVDGALSDADRAVLGAIAANVDDASQWLYGLRAVKLPGEVERLRTAAHLAEGGIDAALAVAASGVTEAELAREVAATMARGGGMPRFVVVTAGERSALSDARATGRALRSGDLVRFDVGCTFDGYWSDVGRTAFVGESPDEVRNRYAAILAGEEAQLAAVKPGLPAFELFDVAVATVMARGLAPYRRHHCGHAIGTEVYEHPIIAPGRDTPLQAGMVLCVETPYYEIGWGGMMVEDTFVVRDHGAELLTRSDRGLRVVEP